MIFSDVESPEVSTANGDSSYCPSFDDSESDADGPVQDRVDSMLTSVSVQPLSGAVCLKKHLFRNGSHLNP